MCWKFFDTSPFTNSKLNSKVIFVKCLVGILKFMQTLTPENIRSVKFSDVFRGHRKGVLGTNGLVAKQVSLNAKVNFLLS